MFFFFLISLLIKTASPAFLAPIAKDLATQRYVLAVYLNTPPQPTNLLLDLGASCTLVNCHPHGHQKTSIQCGPSPCSPCGSPPCPDDTATPLLGDSLTRKPPLTGRPCIGSLSMPVTDGFNPGPLGSEPGFMFSCSKRPPSLEGLVKGADGIAGLDRSNLSIPAQVSSLSSEKLVFALCMSGSPSAPGVAFFGSSGPYYFHPEIDLSEHLNYTPLLHNPVITKRHPNPSDEYFICLTAVKVNGRAIDFNRTLLSIDEKGRGGTKLSTVTRYTVLHRSIFQALTESFMKESAALNLTAAEPVRPFRVCYKADEITSSRVGPSVPTIDFVLQDDNLFWRVFGSNSMVRIYRDGIDVWCLGFLDGGTHPRTSVVIGGHQMEDNLLRFDLESEMLGFSSSVLVHGTMCANFNFTTNGNLRK